MKYVISCFCICLMHESFHVYVCLCLYRWRLPLFYKVNSYIQEYLATWNVPWIHQHLGHPRVLPAAQVTICILSSIVSFLTGKNLPNYTFSYLNYGVCISIRPATLAPAGGGNIKHYIFWRDKGMTVATPRLVETNVTNCGSEKQTLPDGGEAEGWGRGFPQELTSPLPLPLPHGPPFVQGESPSTNELD